MMLSGAFYFPPPVAPCLSPLPRGRLSTGGVLRGSCFGVVGDHHHSGSKVGHDSRLKMVVRNGAACGNIESLSLP